MVKNKGQFVSGGEPWNKGIEFNAGGRSLDTQFKKGQLSGRAKALFKPIGSTRITKDGYLERKISDIGKTSQKWRSEHRIVWERNFGEITDGHIVIFKSGMKTAKAEEVTIEKLELVSRAENMHRNSVHRLPKELAELVQLTGAIQRKINRRLKDERSNAEK